MSNHYLIAEASTTQISKPGTFIEVSNNPRSFSISDAITAINSGSFAVVVVFGIILWQARGSFSKLLDRHISLLDTMKEAIKTDTKVLEDLRKDSDLKAAIMVKLTENISEVKTDTDLIKSQSKESLAILHRLVATKDNLEK